MQLQQSGAERGDDRPTRRLLLTNGTAAPGGELPERKLTWALFQPNAPSGGELRGPSALADRQLLKAQGQYLAERVALVIDSERVSAWPTWLGRIARHPLRTWFRDEVFALPVPAAGTWSGSWPAFALVDAARFRVVADLRAVVDDAASRHVLERLRTI